MENNNKESFKLLGMSASGSDSGSIPEFVVAPRKKKVKRRVRGTSASQPRHSEPCMCKGCSVGLSLAFTLLLCWLAVLTWLAVVLHTELKRLDSNVHTVVAGSQDVPEALQKCHSLSRELQQNQTALFKRLDVVALQLNNFSAQLSVVRNNLDEVQDKLKAAPELVNVPKNLLDLKTNVASFGSKIRDLDATVTDIKNEKQQLQETSKILVQNITDIKQVVTQLVNTTQQSQGRSKETVEEKQTMLAITNQLSQNITTVNETLNSKFQWITEDQKDDHKNVELLRELGQNVSARVTTLEVECAKTSLRTTVLHQVENLTEQVGTNEAQLHDLSTHVAHILSNYTQLLAAVNEMREKFISFMDSYSTPPPE